MSVDSSGGVTAIGVRVSVAAAIPRGSAAAIVAALVMLGVKLPDGLDSQAADIIFTLAPVVALIYGGIVAKANAKKQAEATREIAYAPATVARKMKQVEQGAAVKVETKKVDTRV